jgi:hypothetical protein
VIGWKSGKIISSPVRFVLKGEKLNVLPVQGSETQYYKNVLRAHINEAVGSVKALVEHTSASARNRAPFRSSGKALLFVVNARLAVNRYGQNLSARPKHLFDRDFDHD